MASSRSVESMAPFMPGEEERIFSIMLSASELAKLDLSNILLFPANADCTQNGLKDHEKEFDSSPGTPQESFPFPLEAEEGVSMAPVQVFKSVAVIEAEKSMMEHNTGNNRRRMKSVSMDETRPYPFGSRREPPEGSAAHDKPRPPRLDRLESRGKENQEKQESRGKENQESRDVVEEKKIKKAQDDSIVHDKPRSQPLPVKNSRAEELQPSPVTSFTPAAVPFKWEEVPGKPKTLHEGNQLLPQTNSFTVLHPPPGLLTPPSATKRLTAPQSQSVSQHSRSSSASCGAEEMRLISFDMKRFEESPGSVIPSLDYKFPSPWNGEVQPAYSPFRGLGPPDDAVQRLRKKVVSTLISVWRKAVWRTVLLSKRRLRKR